MSERSEGLPQFWLMRSRETGCRLFWEIFHLDIRNNLQRTSAPFSLVLFRALSCEDVMLAARASPGDMCYLTWLRCRPGSRKEPMTSLIALHFCTNLGNKCPRLLLCAIIKGLHCLITCQSSTLVFIPKGLTLTVPSFPSSAMFIHTSWLLSVNHCIRGQSCCNLQKELVRNQQFSTQCNFAILNSSDIKRGF